MKSVSLAIFIFGLFYFTQGLAVDGSDCVGDKKCCEIEETAGVVSCAKLCDPEIPCEAKEVAESIQALSSSSTRGGFSSGLSSICVEGYRLDGSGKLKKTLPLLT